MKEFQQKLISFYLPQYHPIPENDAWWGKGFTEWLKVAGSKPLFHGHYQPQLPADLGFYDLRLPETRINQASLAKEYGIHGFCYYHYWFNGRRLLERPFNEVLDSGSPDFPFCLCWANENWTRRWDGLDREMLMPQVYSEADDLAHIRWLARAFADPRYIRIDGKPLFLVYRLGDLPDPERTLSTWRKEARRLGVGELYLANVESMGSEHGLAGRLPLDAAVEFAPDWTNLPPWLGRGAAERMARRIGVGSKAHFDNKVYDYTALMEKMLAKPQPAYRRFPCVTPSWDNSARRKGGATIFTDSSPGLYREWLGKALEHVKKEPVNQQVVFVNAWNEWAEGNHLEPCQKWGRQYLEATRDALQSASSDQMQISKLELQSAAKELALDAAIL